MAFFISPGVQVREFDISTVVSLYANSAAAYVGSFEWGPVEDITTISSKARLQKYFGNPTDENATHWFSCSNFLDYANNLKVVRVVNEDIARNATITGGDAQKRLDEIKRISNYDMIMTQLADIVRNDNAYKNSLNKINSSIARVTQVITKYHTALNVGFDADPTATPPKEAVPSVTSQLESKLAELNEAKSKFPDGYTSLDDIQADMSDADVANCGFEQLNHLQSLYAKEAKEIDDIIANANEIIRINNYNLLSLLPDDPQYATKKKTYEDAITSAEGSISTAKANKSLNDEKMKKMQEYLANKNSEIARLQSQYNTIKATYDNYTTLLNDAKKELNAFEQDKLKLQSYITVNNDKKNILDQQLEDFKTDINEAENDLKNSTVFIKNQADWSARFAHGNNREYGEFAAKYPSVLGSNISVYMADINTYTGVTKVTVNVDSYVYTVDDDYKAVEFSLPPTGGKDVASGHIIIDVDNPELDSKGRMTGYYKIKEVVIDSPGRNYRVAPDVTLPSPENPKDPRNPKDGVPKAYATLWKYANQFLSPPNTSNYTKQRGGENDELHIVVVDETGVMTGVKGQVMERFANVSKAEDARYDDGTPAYYAYVLRDQSQYVYWMDHPLGMSNWGLEARNTSFRCLEESYEGHLGGGISGSAREEIGNAELMRGWDCFADTERVDVGILITGPADRVLQQYVINIAEARMDCVAVISPEMDKIVSQPGHELNNLIEWRSSLTASSYGFADCNWKYQYDQYNDTYRWIPCNPDIAGLMARTDEDHDPWWSPAGFNRGHIKNVVKLAWNPDKTDRDEMYAISVNPVCLFLNEGTILYGDKTMLLKTSAFSRINVRRLFIVLEKSIATAAKYMLFEFNDDFTRLRFRQMVEPFLRDVKGRRGVYDYRVVCDASNNTPEVIDANAFVGDIYVKPSKSINFIQLNFIAVATGVAFDEVVGSFGDF